MSLLKIYWIKVALVLVVILGALYLLNPPASVCQSEIELFKDSNQNIGKTYRRSLARCQEDPTIGGCIEFFEFVNGFTKKIKYVGNQCTPELKEQNTVKVIIPSAAEMYVRAAWGSKPPGSAAEKRGFLDLSYTVQYCRIRSQFRSILGEDAWNGFVNRMLADLPGARDIGRDQTWARSILSDPCNVVE